MAGRIWNYTSIIGLILFLITGFSSLSMAAEANLKIAAGSGGTAHVDLINDVPVRGVQFTIEGVKVNEVRSTPRSAGFIVKFNEKNGMVIMVSTSEDTIAPGKGAIAEIVCDKPGSARLSGEKIVGKKSAKK